MRPSRAAFVLTVLVAGRAGAQNADGILLGAEAALTGGAVLATAHDAAGAYYNPAGLAALPASTLQVSGSVYQLSSVRLGSFVRTTLPWTRLDQTLTATDWNTVPSVAVYGFRLAPGRGLALGIWVPTSESISLVSTVHSSGPLTAGGTVLQVDYTQQIAITQRIERTYFGAAAGIEVGPGLRVGTAAFLVYERAEDFIDIFAGALTSSTQNGATASASIRGAPSQLAARLGFGFQWDVAPACSLAAALKTPTLAIAIMGSETTVAQSASLLPGTAASVEFSQVPAPVNRIAEPLRVAAGSAVAIGGVSLRAEVDWQAPRAGRHGTVNGRAGLHRTESPDFAWGVGLFTDRSREDVRSGALSADYYGVAGGVDYRPPPVRSWRKPGAGWDVRTSLAVRYAFGTGEVERLEANPFTSTAAPTAPSTASIASHTLSVNLGALMQF
ncbi:MAG TPA: hypothetical protein VM683_09415 [Anaeromyxobacteraceae bacterium]|nr:hypothetical protein [Anaeromyxobacteraceae bacterium]